MKQIKTYILLKVISICHRKLLLWYEFDNQHQVLQMYHKTSNISCILVGIKIVNHSDVVGASSVGAAPTTSSFSTQHLHKDNCKMRRETFKFCDLVCLILEIWQLMKLNMYPWWLWRQDCDMSTSDRQSPRVTSALDRLKKRLWTLFTSKNS